MSNVGCETEVDYEAFYLNVPKTFDFLNLLVFLASRLLKVFILYIYMGLESLFLLNFNTDE